MELTQFGSNQNTASPLSNPQDLCMTVPRIVNIRHVTLKSSTFYAMLTGDTTSPPCDTDGFRSSAGAGVAVVVVAGGS
jgi:hypothetical protein